MYLIEQLLPAVAVAMATAAAWSALGLRAKGAGASSLLGSLAAGAVGIGYFAGHIFITGWTAFPPTDTTNWLPYFALVTVAAGLAASLLPAKVTHHVVFAVICVGAMRLLVTPKFQHGWTAMQGWLWVGGLSVIALLVAFAVAVLPRRSSVALETPLILITLAAGTAGALMLSGSLLLGQFAAVLAAAVVGRYCLRWRRRIENENSGLDGMAWSFSLLLIALLACGYFFAELPLLSSALLAAAVPAAALLIPIGSSAPRRAAAIRLAIVIATASGALFVAFRSSPPWGE